MSKLNKGMDLNNPSHKIVFDINKKNEEKYGPYHEKCGLFQEFCRCSAEKPRYKKDQQKRYNPKNTSMINTIISELNGLLLEFNPDNKSDFLNYIGNILCQFDTDIAIKVMEDFGEEGREEATRIKVVYGY
jgi:hypothetical protein